MIFNDDEQIVPPISDSTGPKPSPLVDGRVIKLEITNNETAPLAENKQTILLELTGGRSIRGRPGLDLVAVLDVSASMKDDGKIENMKKAMRFVIMKLCSIDRLSIVTFSTRAERLCPLRQMTETSQHDLEDQVSNLRAHGSTNTKGGLEMGLQVLTDRKVTSERTCAIILMSDGMQSEQFGDAASVDLGNVPLHTFGFGNILEPKGRNAHKGLAQIATNSRGGTFSDVHKVNNMSEAFSVCLAGLLTEIAQDLTLTITPSENDSTIEKVSAGDYQQFEDKNAGSVTVTFGNLYSRENRKVLVDLLLHAVSEPRPTVVLRVRISWKILGRPTIRSAAVNISRTRDVSPDQQAPAKVIAEKTRQQNVEMVKEATALADDKKLEDARAKVVEAKKNIDGVPSQVLACNNNALIKHRAELDELFHLMRSEEIYEGQGRPFAYALLISHERQRSAAKGDDIAKFLLFATPSVEKYLAQAKNFDKDPSVPPPSAEDDVINEIATDPLSEIADPLISYVEDAIQALQSIKNIINRR